MRISASSVNIFVLQLEGIYDETKVEINNEIN